MCIFHITAQPQFITMQRSNLFTCSTAKNSCTEYFNKNIKERFWNMAHLWVRAEQRASEQRVGITPQGVQQMIDAGHTITVEKSTSRAIKIAGYEQTGCNIADEHSWINAPNDAIVFGLKELDADGPDLKHKHIMFGHAYKGQSDGPALLRRFKNAGGALYDLEYLTQENGRRVAAFGYWAGFAGAAMGLKVWAAQQQGNAAGPTFVGIYPSRQALVDELKNELKNQKPSSIVIGALGRVGTGACDLLETLGLTVTKWDMAETASGGPFPQIMQHNIFINCILAGPNVPVFVPKSAVDQPRQLTVVADISCDPSSDFNPIPIYNEASTFTDPVTRVTGAPTPLDVTAIDNLPSMLPIESSQNYADQLLPYLLQLDEIDKGVWQSANSIFNEHIALLGN